MPVARLLDGVGRVGADRDLLALAVQVVLEAPGLGSGGQDFEQKAAAIGQRIRLVARLRVVDVDRLEQVVGVPHFSSPGRSHGPMMAPFMAPFRSAVKTYAGKCWDIENEKPQSNQRSGASLWDGLGRPGTRLHVVDHHLPEARARHLRRAVHQAREVVGDLLADDRASPCELMIRSAASVQPMWRSIISARQDLGARVDVVLAGVLGRGAVGGLEHRDVSLRLAPGAMPMPPTCAASASET